MVKYDWSLNKSRVNVESFMKLIETRFEETPKKDEKKSSEKTSPEVVEKYGKCVENLVNGKEDLNLVGDYKNSVKSLYSLFIP